MKNINKIYNYIKTFGLINGLKSGITKKYPNLINHKKVYKRFEKIFLDFNSKYHSDDKSFSFSNENNNSDINKENIFLCWIGNISIPPVIEYNIKSIIDLYGQSHNVHVITNQNIDQYFDTNSKIYKMFKKQKVSTVMFSDVLRVYLLKTFGGLYLDASFILKKDIIGELNIFSYQIFYLLSNELYYCKDLDINVKFSSYFQYANKNLDFYIQFYNLLTTYIEKYSIRPYFLLDMVASFLQYKNIDIELINKIPLQNTNVHFLMQHFSEQATEENLKQADLVCQKLNWRFNFNDFKNTETLGGVFLNDFFNSLDS